jgi:hypothetical protein
MFSTKHLLILILSLIHLQSFSQGFQIPGLITYLPLNGNLDDQSGNGNNAQADDTIFTTNRFGNVNSALSFNNNFIKLPPLILGGNPYAPADVFSGDFTISFWEESSSPSRAYAFSVDSGDGGSNNLNIEFNDGGYPVYTYWNSDGSPAIVEEPGCEYTNSQWHLIVLRRTAIPHKIELFIDKILVGTNSDSTNQTIGSDTSDIYFGKNPSYYLSSYYWIGKLDDIMIFNRAIDSNEINIIYANSIIASIPFEGNYNDDIGNNNLSLGNATGETSDLPTLTTGRFGCDGASHFNGNGYLKLEAFSKNPDSLLLNYFDNDFTISFWEKSNQTNQPMYVLSIDDSTNTNNLNIKFNDGSGCEVYWNGGSNNITCGTINQYTDNQWHHFVLRRNAMQNLIELFIDGALSGSQSECAGTIGSNLKDIIIGHFNNKGWKGSLDDITFYSSCVLNNEIYDSYNLPSPFIDLKYPKFNDSWAAGTHHNITWISNFNGTVNIEYSSDGITWNDIAQNIIVTPHIVSQYLWNIPASITTNCYIRIKSKSACVWQSGQFNIIPSQEIVCYNRWANITMKAPFEARDGAGALVYNNAMWLIGGWNPATPDGFYNTTTNDVWKSTDGLKWTQVKSPSYVDATDPNPLTWESRHCAGYVIYNDEMWIIGGDPNHNHYQNDIWKSKDGRSWTRVAADVPWRNRAIHHTLVHDGKIWVMGGQTFPNYIEGNQIYYNDIWSSTDGINWIQYPNAPWPARGTTIGNVVFNNRMWIIGGATYEGKYYNDVWSSEDGTNWTEHVDFAPWKGWQYHNITIFDGKMWIVGGMLGGGINTNTVWYSSDGTNWYEFPNTPWVHRHAASVYSYDNALWVVAGNSLVNGIMIPDVWKLTCRDHKPASADELDISIYPNPAESFIIVKMKNSIIRQINVKDILGQNLMTKRVLLDIDILEVNISDLKTGIYIMECVDENGFVKSTKFVKY